MGPINCAPNPKEPILKPQVKITIENGSTVSMTLGVDFLKKS